MHIRKATKLDLDKVLFLVSAAFGHDKEAMLVRDLLGDPSAQPTLSLLAFREGEAVGHILFTTAMLDKSHQKTSIVILAPLAIVPDAQRQGVGGKLVKRGLQLLSERGVDLVFVLGYPQYYARHGFKPAGQFGLEPPYPIPDKQADAWMVEALRPDLLGVVSGKVLCADALNKSEYWRE